MPDNFITITPAGAYKNANYTPVIVKLFEHASYGPSGSGGWQVVDRPKSTAATQWFDRSPFQLVFEGILDGESIARGSGQAGFSTYINRSSDPNQAYGWTWRAPGAIAADYPGGLQGTNLSSTDSFSSVDNDCKQIESWLDAVPGYNQPPVFKVSGPVPGTEKYWVVFGVEFMDAIRNNSTGNRIQQHVKFTLYEYIPPLASGYSMFGLTPTAEFNQNNNATGGTTTPPKATSVAYAVKKGDTLVKIANAHRKKGTTAQWVAQIKVMNKIRDDAALAKLIGKKIKLPVE